MKRFVSLFLATVLSVFLLSACATANGAAQGFVELPGDVKSGITALVLVVVSWLLARLISLVPFLAFLDQFRVPVAMAIAVELINLIQNLVPDAYGVVAVLALQLVLAVLALFITFEKLKAMGVRAFK